MGILCFFKHDFTSVGLTTTNTVTVVTVKKMKPYKTKTKKKKKQNCSFPFPPVFCPGFPCSFSLKILYSLTLYDV